MTGADARVEVNSAACDVFLVAVEESADRLGAALMRALRASSPAALRFAGVGGHAMAAEGLASLHSIDDFAIMGFTAVPGRLPRIARHTRQTVRAIRAWRPRVLVVIDNPAYTQWIAWFAHRADPSLPIITYVSPSVWAWHSSRARSMKRYVDHIMALLPFEPDAHQRLGGPPCTYVGHPLIESAALLRPNAEEQHRRMTDPPVLLVLPGSRSGEIHRLADRFGEAVALLRQQVGQIEVVVPGVAHLRDLITEAMSRWPIKPRLVFDDAEKHAAFRVARAALVKSGTGTLEIALAGVPMVAAYRVPVFEALVALYALRVPSIVLANLVLGRNVVPELVQLRCTPKRLADALVPLMSDTPERRAQVEAFATLDQIMEFGERTPAQRAADIVLGAMRNDAAR
jgi:lipid-A-disaccharide synthase